MLPAIITSRSASVTVALILPQDAICVRLGSLAQPIRVYRHPGTGAPVRRADHRTCRAVRLVRATAVRGPWQARRRSTGGGAGRRPRRATASGCGRCKRQGGCGSMDQPFLLVVTDRRIGCRPDRLGAVARRFAGSAEGPPPWARRKASCGAAWRLAGCLEPTSLPTLGAKAPPGLQCERARVAGSRRI